MGHEGAVTALCLLPGSAQLVASTDSAGACHLWSAATGALAALFAEPGAGLAAALLPSKAHTAPQSARMSDRLHLMLSTLLWQRALQFSLCD